MAQILLPRENTLGLLKTYVNSIKYPEDQLSTSNSIFIAQNELNFPFSYKDFEGFGKLGVSSKRLAHDYILVNMFWDIIEPKSMAPVIKEVRKIAQTLSKFSKEDLRILTCLLFYGEKTLGDSEKKRARVLQKEILLLGRKNTSKRRRSKSRIQIT
jgi:hypothetical protein